MQEKLACEIYELIIASGYYIQSLGYGDVLYDKAFNNEFKVKQEST